MSRLLVILSACALACAPQALGAQAAGSIPFAPGVSVTAAQGNQIDSLVIAHRDEVRQLQRNLPQGRLSVEARRAIRVKYRRAIAATLTPAQRAAYLEWASEAEFASDLRRGQSRP